MKSSPIILILFALERAFSSVSAQRMLCITDTRHKGLQGTGFYNEHAVTSYIADCSNFMAVTVTPDPFRIYTAKVTVTVFLAGQLDPNTHPPITSSTEAYPSYGEQIIIPRTAIPTYATYCNGTSAYSCAYSCIGVRKHTYRARRRTIKAEKTATVASSMGQDYVAFRDNTGYRCLDIDNDSSFG